ncbi:preprotein translocase subunit SecG [Robbsia andropogonis]|uniref:preprotein translocase subunit SecG n=1 Tax=Robbsia andropogonis TaxID=28092 RepID=UPI000465AE20|nr:preprotein translocase subunit SecG [Robbsia andropogonis]
MVLLKSLIIVIQVLSALGVIGLVLVQHGKGADMGAAFGSGSSGSLFGASGSSNFLSRTTGVLAGLFFICTLALTYMGSANREVASVGVMGAAPAPVTSVQAGSAPAAASAAGVAPSSTVPGQDVPK